jgi:hypothetical protein
MQWDLLQVLLRTSCMAWLEVHLPIALADHIRGNLGSGCLQADVAKCAGLPNNQQSLPTH